MSDSAKVVVTLKAHGGYDAPWLVFHADSVPEARDLMGQAELSGLLTDVGRVAQGFSAQATVGGSLGAQPVTPPGVPSTPEYAPQTPTYAPQPTVTAGKPDKPCPHGGKKWKSGTNKAGKAYAGWFCSVDKRQGGCDPEWDSNR